MGRAVDYPLRDTALPGDYVYSFTTGSDWKQTWANAFIDLGVVTLVDGLVPPELLPPGLGGGGGDGTGDVVGPASATNNNVALFSGTSGKLIKEGTAGQLVPTAGATEGYFLGFSGGVPVWLANSLTIPDHSIAMEKLIVIPGGTTMGRKSADGSGTVQFLTAAEVRSELQIEAGASADMTGSEIIAAQAAAATASTADAAVLAQAVLAAIASYVDTSPAAAQAAMTSAGLVWTQGLIGASQAVIGSSDNTTSVQAVDMTNGTPTIAGIVAGSSGMIATSEIMASVWAPRQATLVVGALTLDASTGLQWTVAAGADAIVVAESCWTNIPLDKPATLEIVQGGTGRAISFTNTSANLVIDTTSSPWSTANKRMAFELSWVAEGAAPTVKSKRKAVFLGPS